MKKTLLARAARRLLTRPVRRLLSWAARPYGCKWLEVQVPPLSKPGGTAALRVRVANRGTRPWRTGDDGEQPTDLVVRIGGTIQQAVRVARDVAPRQDATFSFEVRLPLVAEAGTCRVELGLVEQKVAWFEDHGVKPLQLDLRMEGGTAYGVEWLGHNLPRSWPAGSALQVDVHVRNTGVRSWLPTLAPSAGPVDLAVFLDGKPHITVRVPREVASGEDVRFSFRLTLPEEESERSLQLRFVEQGLAWFEEAGVQPLTIPIRVERQEGVESRGTYRSCTFIEGAASFHYNSVHICSVPHHNRGQPFVGHFDGTRFPLEELLALREKIRADNAGDGHDACRGCALLEEKRWPGQKYVFDYLGLGNWLYCNIECNYCDLQTQNLAEYAKTFRPYGLVETIGRFIEEGLLAPYAIIDWGGGGEPTYYREFQELLAMLLDHGTFNYIHTNGTRGPEKLRISAPERVHIVCSVDAGLPETYFRIKNRDYLERVWRNLEAYRQMGINVSVKYIVKTESCGREDLEAFAARAARLRPASAVLDIDFNHPDPESEVVEALSRLTHLLRDAGISVRYGHTGDRFTPEMEVSKRVDEAVRLEEAVRQGVERQRASAGGCEGGDRQTLVQLGIAPRRAA